MELLENNTDKKYIGNTFNSKNYERKNIGIYSPDARRS